MTDEFNRCLETASHIIKQRGVADQNSTDVYVDGSLRFERTNTNDVEVTLNGNVVLFAPPPGSSKQTIWEPGGWVEDASKVREIIGLQDRREEQARIFRAKEYCEGYAHGVYTRQKHSTSEVDPGHPSYAAGYSRGLSATNRDRDKESAAALSEREIISDAIDRLESKYQAQAGSFTDEQLKEWRDLQGSIKGNGERDWQDLLLELFRNLRSYEGLAILTTKEEKAAIELLRVGIVRRLAKTSLVLPVPG